MEPAGRLSGAGGELAAFLVQALGWTAFVAWTASFWPQVLLNWRRKSVTGLSVDYLFLNLTKHCMYLIYNAALFCSPVVQAQYRVKYHGEPQPVTLPDLAFSVHSVSILCVQIAQYFVYGADGQRVSRLSVAFVIVGWSFMVLMALGHGVPTGDWLTVVTWANHLQVVFTTFKYTPQAYLNYRRQSTEGWSVYNILLDITGGLASFSQMVAQSFAMESMSNFIGDAGKVGLALITMFFDIVFMIQHWILYPASSKTPATTPAAAGGRDEEDGDGGERVRLLASREERGRRGTARGAKRADD